MGVLRWFAFILTLLITILGSLSLLAHLIGPDMLWKTVDGALSEYALLLGGPIGVFGIPLVVWGLWYAKSGKFEIRPWK